VLEIPGSYPKDTTLQNKLTFLSYVSYFTNKKAKIVLFLSKWAIFIKKAE
jgi:hypothetical protein